MTAKEKLQELERHIDKLRLDNLRMRLQLEALVENINSFESKKILANYRKLRQIRKEQELEGQN